MKIIVKCPYCSHVHAVFYDDGDIAQYAAKELRMIDPENPP